MVRILVLKRLHNLSDEQMEYQLLDRMSYQRFCGLEDAINIPDRTTIWKFEQRIGESGAKALFDGVSTQLLKKGFIARGGQIIDASLVPAPKQRKQTPEAKNDPVRLEASQNVGRKIVMPAGSKSMEKTTMATSFQSTSTRNTKSSER